MPVIYTSERLAPLIEERKDWGQLDKVIKLSVFHSFAAFGEVSVNQVLTGLLEKDCFSCDITVVPGCNFVFRGSEEEVYRQISAIPRITKKVPEKLQVKMIAQRLRKIHLGQIAFVEASEKKAIYGDSPPVLTRDTVTPEGIKVYCDPRTHIYVNIVTHQRALRDFKAMKKAARELVKILNRGNVTEGIINQAWDQFLVERTMSE